MFLPTTSAVPTPLELRSTDAPVLEPNKSSSFPRGGWVAIVIGLAFGVVFFAWILRNCVMSKRRNTSARSSNNTRRTKTSIQPRIQTLPPLPRHNRSNATGSPSLYRLAFSRYSQEDVTTIEQTDLSGFVTRRSRLAAISSRATQIREEPEIPPPYDTSSIPAYSPRDSSSTKSSTQMGAVTEEEYHTRVLEHVSSHTEDPNTSPHGIAPQFPLPTVNIPSQAHIQLGAGRLR